LIAAIMLLVTAASCSKDDVVSKSNAADITAFTVDGAAWNISGTDITYTYPTETTEGHLTPVITLSPGATVTPASGIAQNFFTAQGVTYTVTAEDGATTKTYTAKATRTLRTDADITDFTVDGAAWNIYGTDITYTYPAETQEGQLTPTISLSPGATVNLASGMAQNFFTDQGVTYTVTAEDGATTKTYTAKADKIVASGTTGDCTWTLTGIAPNCTLTISGNGAMADYTYNLRSPWDGYSNHIKTAIIQNGVTAIGNFAFRECTVLTSVSIGNSVTTIGTWAFGHCSGLTSVNIGNSVTTIGNFAFADCIGLTSVNIPNSVNSIGEGAFYDCIGLTEVNIGNSVTTIGNFAFYDCIDLTSVNIPNSVTTIGYSAFLKCSGLTSVSIGNSVTTIGSYAFAYCSSLTEVINMSATPQSITSNVFTNVTLSACTLKVPASAVAAYQAAPVWQNFGTVTGI
jgi:hypothetical protein